MSNADVGTASGTHANQSRSERVCLARGRRESWIRPYRRVRQSIVASRRLIDSSRRIIDRCEKSAADHPLRAHRQLLHVWGRLDKALGRLQRGAADMRQANERIAQSPEYAGDAPRLMVHAIVRWTGAATTVAVMMDELDADRAALVEYVKGAGACLDFDELFKSGGPAPRLLTRRALPASLFSERSRVFCIHVRRKRSARLTVVEAPKRIFRGRAPPPVSTCSL
ncbi:MAG TPA: hypothetical protein VGQ65_04940 [Thermoanaerobaculia bacterium]|nr:hypothetical protein [Thermoanaerobaculia bacterium]